MNRLSSMLLAVGLLATFAPSVARADEPPTAHAAITYEAVDAVEGQDSRALHVTGIALGASASAELRFYFESPEVAERCHKEAMLAMDRPGRYLLEMRFAGSVNAFKCKLVRRNP